MEVWSRLSLGGVAEDTPGLMTDKEDVSALSLGERPLRVGVACLQFKACSQKREWLLVCGPRPRSPEPVVEFFQFCFALLDFCSL